MADSPSAKLCDPYSVVSGSRLRVDPSAWADAAHMPTSDDEELPVLPVIVAPGYTG